MTSQHKPSGQGDPGVKGVKCLAPKDLKSKLIGCKPIFQNQWEHKIFPWQRTDKIHEHKIRTSKFSEGHFRNRKKSITPRNPQN